MYAGINLGVIRVGIGAQVSIFELHVPPYMTFRIGKDKHEKGLCPNVHHSVEIQVISYFLSGSFFVYVELFDGIISFRPFEYFWPAGGDGNTGSWLIGPIQFAIFRRSKCRLGDTSSGGSKGSVVRCIQRSLTRRSTNMLQEFGEDMTGGNLPDVDMENTERFLYSWDNKDAGTGNSVNDNEPLCHPKYCDINEENACSGHGECFRNPGNPISWGATIDEPVAVGCVCSGGYKDWKCGTPPGQSLQNPESFPTDTPNGGTDTGNGDQALASGDGALPEIFILKGPRESRWCTAHAGDNDGFMQCSLGEPDAHSSVLYKEDADDPDSIKIRTWQNKYCKDKDKGFQCNKNSCGAQCTFHVQTTEGYVDGQRRAQV